MRSSPRQHATPRNLLSISEKTEKSRKQLTRDQLSAPSAHISSQHAIHTKCSGTEETAAVMIWCYITCDQEKEEKMLTSTVTWWKSFSLRLIQTISYCCAHFLCVMFVIITSDPVTSWCSSDVIYSNVLLFFYFTFQRQTFYSITFKYHLWFLTVLECN